MYKPVEWSKYSYDSETYQNNENKLSDAAIEDRDQFVSSNVAKISDYFIDESSEKQDINSFVQPFDSCQKESISVYQTSDINVGDRDQERDIGNNILSFRTEMNKDNSITQNWSELENENQVIEENKGHILTSDEFLPISRPQITPTSGYITEDSDQNVIVSHVGISSSDSDCPPDVYTITPLNYENVKSSRPHSSIETEECNSICDEIANAKNIHFQVNEKERDMLSFCKSPSTPLPSALSVLDISSFRLESPTVQDDEEDGCNIPDLADPCSPSTLSKFPSHMPYPAPPSFPPPRLDIFPQGKPQ